jgi:hypothetical protein
VSPRCELEPRIFGCCGYVNPRWFGPIEVWRRSCKSDKHTENNDDRFHQPQPASKILARASLIFSFLSHFRTFLVSNISFPFLFPFQFHSSTFVLVRVKEGNWRNLGKGRFHPWRSDRHYLSLTLRGYELGGRALPAIETKQGRKSASTTVNCSLPLTGVRHLDALFSRSSSFILFNSQHEERSEFLLLPTTSANPRRDQADQESASETLMLAGEGRKAHAGK